MSIIRLDREIGFKCWLTAEPRAAKSEKRNCTILQTKLRRDDRKAESKTENNELHIWGALGDFCLNNLHEGEYIIVRGGKILQKQYTDGRFNRTYTINIDDKDGDSIELVQNFKELIDL